FEVRLKNGEISTTENVSIAFGRLEVKRAGVDEEYGTVCDDSFHEDDARVACRMLGFSDGTPVYFATGFYGLGNGSVWLSNLHCTGNESNLGECTSSEWGVHHCSHEQDVSVACGYNPFPSYYPTTAIEKSTFVPDNRLSCDFEDEAVCGYNIQYPNLLYTNPADAWKRRGHYHHQIPPYDKTYGDNR
ncbi:LOXL4-like protein, partial [Mya arenaria]